MDVQSLDLDAHYTHTDFKGVALWLWGPEMTDTEDTWWDGIQKPTGNVIVTMVGDDKRYAVDPDGLTVLPEGASCPGCGQLGGSCYSA